jgi:hypothetical protein
MYENKGEKRGRNEKKNKADISKVCRPPPQLPYRLGNTLKTVVSKKDV